MYPLRLHDERFAVSPHSVWAELRNHFPVYHDPVDDVYLVTRHADVLAGFSDVTRFSNRLYRKTLGRVFGPTMLEMDGADHIQRRKVVSPVFAPTRLEAFYPLVESVVGSLLDDVAGETCFDLVSHLANRLPGTVIVHLLGFPPEQVPLFYEWYEAMMKGLWNDERLRERGRQAHLALHHHLAPEVAARRLNPRSDLLSRLIDHQVNDLAAFVSLLLTAGGETTDKVLSNLWHNLLTNPEQLELVRAEPVLLDHAFAETMRFSPPLVYLGREVVEPIELHGVTIPAGAELRLGVGSANRDETVFTNPDRFDLTRTDLHKGLEHRSISYTDGAGHLSFGAGPHFCLGYALARLEVTVASRMLLERFPRLALAEDPPPIRVEGPSQSPGRLLVRV